MLRVELLGPARMFFGGTLFAYKAPPKCLPLLGYLLLHRETPINREALAYSLWPDDSEQEARAKLRRHLHRLSRALPVSDAEWVLTDTTTVRWNPVSDFQFDVDEFIVQSAQPDARELTVHLYRGELLEGVYEDWVFRERERMRAIQIENYNALIQRAQSDRSFDRAIGFAKQLLALDPWRENTLRTLMMLRQAQGDRAGAIAEYEAFAARLKGELDAEPVAESVAAYESLLRNESLWEMQPTEGVDQRAGSPAALLPFAGRVEEMARLSLAWGRAARGHGQTVFLTGEAGVGKSRFIQEFAAIAGNQGAIVLSGSTTLPEAQPYQAVIELLRAALPIVMDANVAPVWLSVLSLLLPEMRSRRPDLPPLQLVEPARERSRLFEAIIACLSAVAKQRPLVIVIEDVQWAGSATTDFILALSRRTPGQPILLVLTYRDEEVERTHAIRKHRRMLEREQIASHIPLGRLTQGAVCEIVRKTLEDEDSGKFGVILYEQTEGNALFLSQALRNIRDGRAPMADTNVNAVMDTNISRLSDRALSVAQGASVLGRAFDVELLRELGNWDEEEVSDAMDELLDRAIVRESSAVYRRDFAFSHNLLQTQIYSGIDTARRARHHRRAAKLLAEMYADIVDVLAPQIAYHHEQAGDPDAAASFYVRASERAAAIFANDEALEYARKAAVLTRDSAVHWRAFTLQETIYERLGARSEQRAVLETLRDIAARIASAEIDIELQRRLVRFMHALGERDAERAELERLQALAVRLSGPWEAEAALARGVFEMANGNLEAALGHATIASEKFANFSDDRSISAMCLAAEIEALRGRFEEAIVLLNQARQAADAANNTLLVMRCLNASGMIQFSHRRFADARDNALQMLELCERVGDRQGAANAHSRLASAYGRMFEYNKAQEHYGAAAADYAHMHDRQGEAIVLLNSSVLNIGVGDLHSGIKGLERAAELFTGLGDLRGQALSLGNLSFALRGVGRLREAVQAAQRGLDLALQMNSPAVEAHLRGNMGAAYRDLGELDLALPQLEKSVDIRRSMDAAAEVPEDFADLALAFLIQGRVGEALAIVEELSKYDALNLDAWYPQDAWWIAARVRAAAGDEAGYSAALLKASDLLSYRQARIRDSVRAEQYAKARYNAEIAAAAALELGK